MYHTTGFTLPQVVNIVAMINHAFPMPARTVGRKPTLSRFTSVVVALTYMRRNRAQAEIAESENSSQPTISRTITAYVPLIRAVLADWVPTVEDIDPNTQLIIDGTLLPCWSWKNRPELWSGKHKTTGVNVQVACDLTGRLVWISDPLPGSVHDAKAIRASGLLDTPTESKPAPQHFGDKGYIGLGMITPIRKKPGQEHLTENEKTYNQDVNHIRYQIERTIAHLKTWRILHTDYRRPYKTFPETIATVIALHFYQKSF
jgi:DDE superfamily endonuclease